MSSYDNGDVLLYDSSSTESLTPSLEKQLLELYHTTVPSKSGLLVTSAAIQQQTGRYDCGLFAIGIAFHLAIGDKIEDVKFDQDKLRGHVAKCFEKKRFSRFPQSKKTVQRNESSNINIPSYCTCRRPDSYDDMILCNICDSWYHFKCVRLRKAPLADWFCFNCRSK